MRFVWKQHLHRLSCHLDDTKGDITESLQLLKSSVVVNEDNVLCTLDNENYSEEFKAKIYALLKKGEFQQNSKAISSDRNDLSEKHDNPTTSMAENNAEDILLDIKTLTMDEKAYLVHLTCIHLQLAHQRNQLLHWFYVPALATLVAKSFGKPVSEGRNWRR